MERYGTADLIHDILERQGLSWLLGDLVEEESQKANAQGISGTQWGSVNGQRSSIFEVTEYIQSVVTENGADKTYLLNAGPDTVIGRFSNETDITYPIPAPQLQEFAFRQHMAQRLAEQDRASEALWTKFEQELRVSYPCDQNRGNIIPRNEQVNGWKCVKAPPVQPRSQPPPSRFFVYSPPLPKHHPARYQTDGSCCDLKAYQQAHIEDYSQVFESVKAECKSSDSESNDREITKSLIQAAATKLLDGLNKKEKQEKRESPGCQQIEILPERQDEEPPQQDVVLPFTLSFGHDENIFHGESVASYRIGLNQIMSRANRSKIRAHRKGTGSKVRQNKSSQTFAYPAVYTPPPEQCVVEAKLCVHLSGKGEKKAGNDRKNVNHLAKRTNGNRGIGKPKEHREKGLGRKRQESSDCSATDDYVRVKYGLVKMYDDDDDDDEADVADAGCDADVDAEADDLGN